MQVGPNPHRPVEVRAKGRAHTSIQGHPKKCGDEVAHRAEEGATSGAAGRSSKGNAIG